MKPAIPALTAMDTPAIHKDLTVEQILSVRPQAAQTFREMKTACLGCRLERFCSLEQVARQYDLDLNIFLARLQQA
jgi:hybrid cluster-associated redox disulfide protein